MEQNTVFISYRRSLSRHLARSIYMALSQHGWDVFLDVNTIDSGDFDRIILNQIAARAHFILLISPGSLERCADAGDWVLREIEEAIRLERNIVPIVEEGADFTREMSYLPLPIRAAVSKKNGLPLPHFYFDAAMDTLRSRFLKAPEYIRITETPTAERAEVQRRIQAVDVSPSYGSGVGVADSAAAIRAVIGDPFEWCPVPAGDFLYGEQKLKLTLPAFQIAKYPITYQQFETFIKAQDGFRDSRWWHGLAADAEHRAKPGDQAWKIADHPRENVSWYDAIAFCRWLSFKVGGGYVLEELNEWMVRLPTEFEWERAARGTYGRMYPYGNKFDQNRCNTRESGKKQTTPVLAYPQGASPVGAVDMSGNVWEWCMTNYYNPATTAAGEKLSSYNRRVRRGGSFHFDQHFAYAANRSHRNPDDRDFSYGFRLAASFSIS